MRENNLKFLIPFFLVASACGGGGGTDTGNSNTASASDAFSQIPTTQRDTENGAFYLLSNVSSILRGPGVFNVGYKVARLPPSSITSSEPENPIKLQPYAYPLYGNGTFGVAENTSSKVLCTVDISLSSITSNTGVTQNTNSSAISLICSYGTTDLSADQVLPLSDTSCISPGEKA